MGAAIAARFVTHGVEVLTLTGGRSSFSVARRQAAGAIETDLFGLAACDFIFSILPSDTAVPFSESIVPALNAVSRKGVFVECNPLSPTKVRHLEAQITSAGWAFVDAAIIGAPPLNPSSSIIFLTSGPHSERVQSLESFGFNLRDIGGKPGDASALKLLLSGLTKGFLTLANAVFASAEGRRVSSTLESLFEEAAPELWRTYVAGRSRLHTNRARWSSELSELHEFLRELDPKTEIYSDLACDLQDRTEREG